MKRLIAFISILMLASVVSGTATSITIYGTNQSNAQTNVTCYGCNNTISVQAWNISYVKNISVNSLNASGDVVSFNISNVTAYQVQELKVNKTAVNAYQAGANGMLNFSYTVIGNRTLTLSPASTMVGYNSTWWFFQTIRAIGTGNSSFAGNVGIGTTVPRALFSIVSGADNANYQQNGKMQITAPSNRPDLTGSGTIVVESNDAMGIDKGASIAFGGRHNSATSQGDTWGAIFGGKESATDAERKGYLALFTSPTGTITERMRITSGGNVGIGTTSPASLLDVNGVISGNGSGLSGLNGSNVTGFPVLTQYTSSGIVLNTVYYNNNKTAIFVNMRADCDTSRGVRARSDASNPPLGSVAAFVSAAPGPGNSLAFFVLPGNYYMMSETGIACADANSTIWR